MNTSSCLLAGFLALACLPFCALAAPAEANKVAAEACEKEVTESVKALRGKDAQEVQFIGAQRVLAPVPGGEDMGVKGEGRYKRANGAAIAFTYSCTYSAETTTATGVVFSDKGYATANASRSAAWQPDLTYVSPDACEQATAVALKQKYPRVERITFGSDSRQLKPAPNAGTSLEGQGALARAPGMNAVPFSYRCEFAPQSARVVSVQTRD